MGFKSYFCVVSGDRYSTVDANARPLQHVQANSRSTATSPLKKQASDSTLQSRSSKTGKGGKLSKMTFDLVYKIRSRKDSGPQGELDSFAGPLGATKDFPMPFHPTQARGTRIGVSKPFSNNPIVSQSFLNTLYNSLIITF
jgi:hypothetical protein